ncbi:MAG: hypothetical protein AAGB46_05035 [Verrucomicrobiota bacterium]
MQPAKHILTLLPAILILAGCSTTQPQRKVASSVSSMIAAPTMQYATASRPISAVSQLTPHSLKLTPPAASAAAHPQPKLSSHLTSRFFLLAQQIEAELAAQGSLNPAQLEFSDRLYVLPSHDWLVSTFLPYIDRYFEKHQIRNIGEGLDCDNIAQLFRHQLVLSNAQGGGARAGDIPCGILKTQQRRPFGGVPGDGSYHSLILLRTDKGWHAIEPQTQTISPLATYPNTPHIDWALF